MPGLIANKSILSLIGCSHVLFTVHPHLGRNLGAGKGVAVSCVALTVPCSKRVLFVTVSRRPFLAPTLNVFALGPLGHAQVYRNARDNASP
jgi:hypothetical protein